MIEFRHHFCDAVVEGQERLGIATDAALVEGLLRITLSLPSPAFNHRRKIDDWMFNCTLEALKRASKSGVSKLPLFRGVDKASLERALRNGIDVEPTYMHWYGADLEKALEYGGDNPAVLIIDGACAQRPFRDVPIHASGSAHAEAQRWAASEAIASEDGQSMRYSRLPLGDSRRGSSYETTYAWYLPGNPLDALLGVIECKMAAIDHD